MPCFCSFNKSLDNVPLSAGIKFSSVVKTFVQKKNSE